jgi:hypothetical protein
MLLVFACFSGSVDQLDVTCGLVAAFNMRGSISGSSSALSFSFMAVSAASGLIFRGDTYRAHSAAS